MQENNLVIARTGGTVGKTFVIENLQDDSVFASYLIRAVFGKNISAKYIKIFSGSPIYWQQIIDNVKGAGQPNVNGQSLSKLIIPLPPLAEQNRIVARLEKILPEVEALAKAETELNNLQNNFPRQFKNSILQDAIQGNLTKQLQTDGDAKDLLKQIRDEKNKLISVGKLKPEKPLPPIQPDELPFAIPKNWAWVRLPEIIYTVGGKHNQILAKEIKKSGKYPVISQGQNFIDGFTDEKNKLVYDFPLIMFGDHTRNVKFIDFPFVIVLTVQNCLRR